MTSEVVLFLGPSATEAEARAILPTADVRPPAAQGDVLDAAMSSAGCRVIGLVDGYFESVPAVWHKEILWAMAQGIHVFGAASMGALRAAELHAFGMEGVGAIFEAFRDGDLDADDEVAVLHAPADAAYKRASEAFVNVRATVGAALIAGVVTESFRDQVVVATGALFYPDRTYPAILAELRRRGTPLREVEAFARFIEDSAIDQKREDALEMFDRIRARLRAGLEPKVVSFSLQHSGYFEVLREEVLARSSGGRQRAAAEPLDHVLDEVRIDPGLERVDALALRLAIAGEEARDRHVRFDDERALVAAADAFRRESSLIEAADFDAFLTREAIDDEELPRILESFAATRWHRQAWRARALARYHDALKLLGLQSRVVARASRKAALLQARGIETPCLDDARITEDALLAWYFDERLRRDRPPDIDAYAERVGFESGDAFIKALIAEYIFTTAAPA